MKKSISTSIAVLFGMLVIPAFSEVAPVMLTTNDIGQYVDAGGNLIATDANGNPIVDANGNFVLALPADNNGVEATSAVAQTPPPAAPTQLVAPAAVSAPAALSPQQAVAGRTAITRGAAVTRVVAAQQNSGRAVVSRGNPPMVTLPAPAPAPTMPAMPAPAPAHAQNVVARAGIIQTDTVNKPLYNPTTSGSSVLYNAGMTTGTTTYAPTTLTMNTGSSLRTSGVRTASVSSGTSNTTNTAMTADEIAQLSDFCKAQYYSCMDGFCAVLDDNQGRCSCSADVTKFQKSEDALKQATSDLQDAGIKIQYIAKGLTKDEVTAMFQQTEAEAAMQGVTDTSQLKGDLDKIQAMIVDIKPGTSNASSDFGFSIDLTSLLNTNFDLGNGFDLNSLFGGLNGSGTSISGQRGAELYKTASARCQSAVLTSCKNQGIDTTVITNGYDLEIDRQCTTYEKTLQDSNDQMKRLVKNANIVLQVARLGVAQAKNKYATMPDCLNALDACMQNDFVCGADYVNCLDPTGSFIANGAVVVGSQPGIPGGPSGSAAATSGLYKVWGTAWTTNGNLSSFITSSIGTTPPTSTDMSTNIVKFLNYKIGWHDTQKGDTGNCMSVLNQCQKLTYTGSGGIYANNNDVVISWLNRALMSIKAKQDTILSNYATQCVSDVGSCLSRQNVVLAQLGTGMTSAALGACTSIVKTCSSVNGYDIATCTAAQNPDGSNPWLAILSQAVCTGGQTITSCSNLTCACNGGLVVNQSTLACCPAGTKYNTTTLLCQ